MMKRLFITLMVGLSTMAAVSCDKVERRETETGLFKANDIKATQIATNYDHKVKIEKYIENGDVKNYYVSYTHPLKCTNMDGDEKIVTMVYVEKYNPNLTVEDWNIGNSYYEAMSYFGQIKP